MSVLDLVTDKVALINSADFVKYGATSTVVSVLGSAGSGMYKDRSHQAQ